MVGLSDITPTGQSDIIEGVSIRAFYVNNVMEMHFGKH